MVQDILSHALNCIMNALRAKNESCSVQKTRLLVGVLDIMKKNGYIQEYHEEDGKIVVKIGNVNECRAIKPRFYVGKGDLEKYIRRFLPARDFGVLIVSTNRGLMTHKEALERGLGGSLIAYCF